MPEIPIFCRVKLPAKCSMDYRRMGRARVLDNNNNCNNNIIRKIALN